MSKEILSVLAIFTIGFCLISFRYAEVHIPEFESNAVRADSMDYKIHQLLSDDRIFLISLEEDSYWYKEGINTVLILDKKNHWSKALLHRNKLSKELNLISLKKLSRKQSETANSLISYLNESPFLELTNDSLNLATGMLPDTIINGEVLKRTKFLSISDGVNYRFEVLAKDNHRVVETYEPYLYYEYFPEIWQKGIFIEFLDQFKESIN